MQQHLLKWMIWGCPHFRKPPNGKWDVSLESLSCRCYTKVHLVPYVLQRMLPPSVGQKKTILQPQSPRCRTVPEWTNVSNFTSKSQSSTISDFHWFWASQWITVPKKNYLLLAISIHVSVWVSVHLSVRPSIHASRHFTTSVDSWNAIDRLPIAAKRRKTLATRSLNQIVSSTIWENNKTQVRKAQHTAAAMRLHVDTRVEVCLLWRRWPLPTLGWNGSSLSTSKMKDYLMISKVSNFPEIDK